MRLRDHGAWPGISQYSISHVAFFLSRIFISHVAFACRIFISHIAFLSRTFISHLAFLSRMSHFYLAFLSHISYFYLASRIFISHFYLTSRIFISHLAFLSCISHFLSRISHSFYLASRILISHLTPEIFSYSIKSHLECPLQASVVFSLNVSKNTIKHFLIFNIILSFTRAIQHSFQQTLIIIYIFIISQLAFFIQIFSSLSYHSFYPSKTAVRTVESS